MRAYRKYSGLVLGAMLISSPATAEGDPAKGLEYAKKSCANCHAITASAKVSPNMLAPPFGMIAKSKMVTTREIIAWLQSSHPDMPDLVLEPNERDDLVAYIKSLEFKQ